LLFHLSIPFLLHSLILIVLGFFIIFYFDFKKLVQNLLEKCGYLCFKTLISIIPNFEFSLSLEFQCAQASKEVMPSFVIKEQTLLVPNPRLLLNSG
jgi:hypothetical protein